MLLVGICGVTFYHLVAISRLTLSETEIVHHWILDFGFGCSIVERELVLH